MTSRHRTLAVPAAHQRVLELRRDRWAQLCALRRAALEPHAAELAHADPAALVARNVRYGLSLMEQERMVGESIAGRPLPDDELIEEMSELLVRLPGADPTATARRR